jgi:serine/threonine protein kinase/Flp pilus assembly protein TadD
VAGDSDFVEEILADWRERRDRGDYQDPEDVVRAHPDLEEGLRTRFRALDVLELTLAYGADAARALPRQIGEYRILRELGRGGMGDVYEAEQVSMQRRVALKVLHPRITNSSHAVKRFQREARAAGRLHHTNIVPVFGMGCEGGSWFYAMELVEGATLERILERMRGLKGEAWAERMTLLSTTEGGGAGASPSTAEGAASGTTPGRREYYGRIAEMFAGVAEALQLAHEQGVIHRDIKPSNLILDPAGWLKITDFGLARVEGEAAALTVSGSRIGTPLYMSPEQAMARRVPVDHRTDIYSLGATLYETLTLRPPYEGTDLPDLCRQILTTDPALPSRLDRNVPRNLETIALKAMEKERERRYGSAVEMARDLRAFARGDAISARPVGPVGRLWRRVQRHRLPAALAAAVVVLGAGGAGFWARSVHQARELRDLAYRSLLEQSSESLLEGPTVSDRGELSFAQEPTLAARRVLSEAIALSPDRAEGYLLRALAPGSSLPDRLKDLEEARARGLGERAAALARANLFRIHGEWDTAQIEESRAAVLPRAEPALEAYLEGSLLLRRRSRKEAIELLSGSIETASQRAFPWSMALLKRAVAREVEGDLAAAIDDYGQLLGAGKASIRVRIRMATLWRRIQKENRAEEIFREVLAETRKVGTVAAWETLCGACVTAENREWSDLATSGALRAHAEGVDLISLCAEALAAGGRLDEALDLSNRAVLLDARNAFAWNVQGAVLWRLGKLEETVQAYEKCLSLHPENAGVQRDIGVLLTQLKRAAEALPYLERAVSLDPKNEVPRCSLSYALLSLNRLEDALKAAEEARRLDPGSAAALACLGNAQVFLRRDEEALQSAERALAVQSTLAVAHFVRGTSLLNLGKDLEGAVASLREAIRLDGSFPMVMDHVNLGYALLRQGKCEEAVSEFRGVLRLDPTSVEALVGLGAALAQTGHPEEALGRTREALALNGNNAEALCNLGRFLRDKGNLDDAIAALRRSALLDPSSGECLDLLGTALCQKGDPAEGALVLERACKLNLVDAGERVKLGLAREAAGDLKAAIDAYRAAVRLDPKLACAQYSLGRALLIRGSEARGSPDMEASLAANRIAVELEPSNPDANIGLGDALRGMGRFQEAVPFYRKGCALEPESSATRAEWLRALLDLERLASAEEALDRTPEGKPVAEDPQVLLDMAEVADHRAWFARAAELRASAFERDGALADKLKKGTRYEGACCAALASCGMGRDGDRLDGTARVRWRRQALAWLRADLVLRAKMATSSDEKERQDAAKALEHWKRDTDLQGLRDEARLAEIPEEERTAFRALWAEVDAAIARAKKQ